VAPLNRRTAGIFLAVAAGLSSLAVSAPALGAGTRTINFDDVTAPCVFMDTGPLTTYYQALGVTFAGPAAGQGGAILNQCAAYAVSGFSAPNFLAFATGTYAPGPETITFASPVYAVEIKAGDGIHPDLTTLSAFNGSTLVAESSRTETAAMQTMSVRASRITSVRLSFAGDLAVYDDLVWSSSPVSAADTSQTTRATTLTVPAPGVLANDSDPNGDPLTAAVTRTPANGTVVMSPDGAFGYVPNAGFVGADTFDYVASDGAGTSDEATVRVNVVAPLPPPPPVQCRVPKVVGLRLAAAKTKIRRAHCAVGKTRRKRSKRVGRVLSQSPRAGTRRPRGAKVNLVVGRR
jgi:hypothetical protein